LIMEEDKIKKILAVFLQKEPSEINSDTLINNSAIPGSILIHMVYRELGLAGFQVKKYMDINTYGDLINRINGTEQTAPVQMSAPVIKPVQTSAPVIQPVQISVPAKGANSDLEIGIDIESISNFPVVNDYREDPFYKTNFTTNEISYCILKPSPIESFAGLFCLKEAICKTNENYRKISFNQIEITHTAEGKPLFQGYALSVSHTKDVATGVAVKGKTIKEENASKIEDKDDRISKIENMVEAILQNKTISSGNKFGWISIVALLLAVAAIIIEIFYKK
jgi:phosphopantetheine--protein transferase-like protein